MTLRVDDFAAFFQEVHGYPPFPWQSRLLAYLVDNEGKWPEVLDLPTGSGKTAAMDVALFHLALEAGKTMDRKAPVRIAFVVDRRLIVDDAHNRAKKLACALTNSTEPVTQKVATQLRLLSGDDAAPLIARQLRGGIPREDDWARTPCQPTILCSTVDQVGSRLLFRGYGVSDSMKPVHAGLLGTDCLILLDEAHLAEPFRQTLKAVELYTGDKWRAEGVQLPPFRTALLTATPGTQAIAPFKLDEADYQNEILTQRLAAPKPARLVLAGKAKAETDEDVVVDNEAEDLKSRLNTLAELVDQALQSAPAPAIAVVVNRVKRARALFNRLRERHAHSEIDIELIIGPARPIDREAQANAALGPIRTGNSARPSKPLIIIATQTIEAGVDIDFDALITEAAPVDALRQRFGRLNRAGRDIMPFAAIVAVKSDVSSRADDPVYGRATAEAWTWLNTVAASGAKKDDPVVDFGIEAFKAYGIAPEDAVTKKLDAPVLMPAHADLLSQTSPVPACDPDVALYLHGPNRQPASVSVIWRADVDGEQDTHRLMTLVPPRTGEAIELPIGAVKGWLTKASKAYGELADVAAREDSDEVGRRPMGEVYRFRREADRSGWIWPSAILPGDTIIVPCGYGGVDRHGFAPDDGTASDVADEAAKTYTGKRFAVRVAPGLLDADVSSALSNALADAVSENWRDLRNAVLDLSLPETIRAALKSLDERRGEVQADTTVYGQSDGKPRGIVFLAPRGLKHKVASDETTAVTEDDTTGTLMGFAQSLEAHSGEVETQADAYAEMLGLEKAGDIALAAWLHDLGKADPRFQAWLHYGDPLRFIGSGQILAKSGRTLPKGAHSKTLPDQWRHEAQSVRIAREHPRFAEAADPELVLWLIGTHHGRGRPFFPHADDRNPELPDVMGIPRHLPDTPGPQSLAFDRDGQDWPSLFARLKTKYGVWGLAWLETIVRLADHRASEAAQQRGDDA